MRQVNLASETWKIGDKCTRRTEALVSIMICLWYRIDTSKIYIYIYMRGLLTVSLEKVG